MTSIITLFAALTLLLHLLEAYLLHLRLVIITKMHLGVSEFHYQPILTELVHIIITGDGDDEFGTVVAAFVLVDP